MNSKWEVVFTFPKPIEENSAKDIEYIKFQKEDERDGKIILSGFSVITPTLCRDEAELYAKEKANRILDYMSAIHGVPIKCSLNSIGEFRPPGELRTRETYVKINSNVNKPCYVDFTELRRIITGQNLQLMRQLSHYRRGLEAEDDTVAQIREYYMVVEDEYDDPNHDFIKTHSHIRHFVSHFELPKPNAKKKAETSYGQNYNDLSDPKISILLKKDLVAIKEKARDIIISKTSKE